MDKTELMKLHEILTELILATQVMEDLKASASQPLISFSDGQKIMMPVSQSVQDQLSSKILSLSELVINNVNKLGIANHLK